MLFFLIAESFTKHSNTQTLKHQLFVKRLYSAQSIYIQEDL